MAKKEKKEKQKKKKKSIVTLSGFIVLLVLAAGTAFYFNLESISRAAVEETVSATLGVPVTIEKLAIDTRNKRVTLGGLHIGNPPGYRPGDSIGVKTISIAAESLSRELLVFKDITVSGAEINLEVTEKGTNLTDMRRNVVQAAAPAPVLRKTPAKSAPKVVKVIIRDLRIDEALLNPSVTLLGKTDLKAVLLPDIHLTGIGEKDRGVLASQAMAQVLDHMVRASVSAAGQAGFLSGLSPDALKAIGADFSSRLIGNIKDVADRTESGLMSIGREIKGLFGKLGR